MLTVVYYQCLKCKGIAEKRIVKEGENYTNLIIKCEKCGGNMSFVYKPLFKDELEWEDQKYF